MTRSLIVFPDTNLFAQCQALESLKWSDLGEYDDISVFVCRPVQQEIDRHKGKGSGRLSERGRRASALFKQAIKAKEGHVVLRESAPVVRLYLRIQLKPDPGLETLDYTQADDQLVGIAAAYASAQTDIDVMILTHDAGPMALASAVGVDCKEIPEEWLLKPETDESDKATNAARAELERYKNLEPRFEAHVESVDPKTGRWTAEVVTHPALDPNQIDALMLQLTTQNPKITAFDTEEKEFAGIYAAAFGKFTPPSEEDISRYSAAYDEWIDECRTYLENIHASLQLAAERPKLTLSIRNVGSRPAQSALVKIAASGSFGIAAPPRDEDKEDAKSTVQLPRKPAAPRGRRSSLLDSISLLGTSSHLLRGLVPLSNSIIAGPASIQRHDPDAFYWKPSRPSQPTRLVSLECAQWRHEISAQSFEFTVFVAPEPGAMKGALEVSVHASNLTIPFVLIQPITVSVTEGDTAARAAELIDHLS